MLKKLFFCTISIWYVIGTPIFAVYVHIWEPDEKNKYGHVAIQTNKYNMSLWPDCDVKEDCSVIQNIKGQIAGCLIIHHEYDRYLEGNRDPIQLHLLIDDLHINGRYEEMLRYNNINPYEVNMEKGEEIMRLQEHKPEKSLEKSTWNLGGMFYAKKFYTHPQSCTTFALALLFGSDVYDTAAHDHVAETGSMLSFMFPFIAVKEITRMFFRYSFSPSGQEEEMAKEFSKRIVDDLTVSTQAALTLSYSISVQEFHFIINSYIINSNNQNNFYKWNIFNEISCARDNCRGIELARLIKGVGPRKPPKVQ